VERKSSWWHWRLQVNYMLMYLHDGLTTPCLWKMNWCRYFFVVKIFSPTKWHKTLTQYATKCILTLIFKKIANFFCPKSISISIAIAIATLTPEHPHHM
jgi:hypothetical protein